MLSIKSIITRELRRTSKDELKDFVRKQLTYNVFLEYVTTGEINHSVNSFGIKMSQGLELTIPMLLLLAQDNISESTIKDAMKKGKRYNTLDCPELSNAFDELINSPLTVSLILKVFNKDLLNKLSETLRNCSMDAKEDFAYFLWKSIMYTYDSTPSTVIKDSIIKMISEIPENILFLVMLDFFEKDI